MAIGKGGDVVTFLENGTTTTYGIVIGTPDTTHNLVAYDFGVPNKSQIDHAKEQSTTSVTVVLAGLD